MTPSNEQREPINLAEKRKERDVASYARVGVAAKQTAEALDRIVAIITKYSRKNHDTK